MLLKWLRIHLHQPLNLVIMRSESDNLYQLPQVSSFSVIFHGLIMAQHQNWFLTKKVDTNS